MALIIVAFLSLGDLSSKKDYIGDPHDAEYSEEEGFEEVNTKNMHQILKQAEKATLKESLYYDETLGE